MICRRRDGMNQQIEPKSENELALEDLGLGFIALFEKTEGKADLEKAAEYARVG
jgi:hypothetical protein